MTLAGDIAAARAAGRARLARARIHEAGHAVAIHALGQEAGAVVVFGGEAGDTHHWAPAEQALARMSATDRLAALEADVVIALAGEAALEVFGDSDPRRGADGDRDAALEAAYSLDPVAPGATVARLYVRALALVREHRAAIERFAATLRVNGDRLAGEQVADALNAAFAGWPSPIFGAARDNAVITAHRALFEAAMADDPPSAVVAWFKTGRAARAQVDGGDDRHAAPAKPAHEPRPEARPAPIARAYANHARAAGEFPTVAGLFAFARRRAVAPAPRTVKGA